MKRTKNVIRIVLLFVMLAMGSAADAQVTISSSDSLTCTTLCTTLTATVVGDTPIDAGITSDDIYSPLIPIGFTFNYYGIPYTQIVIGANGTLNFDAADAGAFDPWTISAPLLGNASKFNNICGPWVDIDIFSTGAPVGTETYSTSGVAPFRRFSVSWCGCSMFSCTDQRTTTQIILHETTNIIEVHISAKPVCSTWNGGRAIVGVQNATGTAATTAPGRDFPSVWTVPPREAWRFTPDPTGTSYTCTSIPHAPIPLASSPVYWYNAATGAYLGTGYTLPVCPTEPTTYKAGALGCSDTSFAYYTVTPTGSLIVTSSSTQPSRCNTCDGTITLDGMEPGAIDTIDYMKDGVPQATIIATVSAAGTVTITGLCAGVYTGIIVRQASCVSLPQAETLVYPPISITSVTPTNVSFCGVCDGQLLLNGLYPSQAFTVTYTFNGVAQPPVSTFSNSAGSITLSGLCEGTYDNIVAYFAVCTTAAVGPFTLTSPPLPPGSIVSFNHPTECGFCNGRIVLKGVPPFSSDTVSFTRAGVPQTRVITTALADSTVVLSGLCSGTYSGFEIKIGNCIYTVPGSVNLVDPPLTAGFSYVSRLGCNGDSVLFSNSSSSAGPLYYIWKFGDGTTDTSKNPLHIYAQGSYTVTLLATNHACLDSAKAEFTFDHPLNAAFVADPIIVCQGSPVTFTNSSVANAPTYMWTFESGVNSGSTNPTYTFNKVGQYNVQLIVTDTIPCMDTAYVTVTVDSNSALELILTDSVLCAGTYVTFKGLYSTIGNTGVSWNFGNGDSILNVNPVSHAFNAAGVYTVSVTPHFRACRDTTASKVVTIFPQPFISLGTDTSICAGSETVTLKDELNAGNPGASWAWSNGSKSSSAVIVAPGIYFATVNINNCYASDTIVVLPDCYMNIPNVFTPNGDGLNDFFYPRSLLTRGLIRFKMNLYNRWGQVIFETSSLDGAGWDGKLNGVPQPQGVYVYVIDAEFRDGQKEHHQGNVTLVR